MTGGSADSGARRRTISIRQGGGEVDDLDPAGGQRLGEGGQQRHARSMAHSAGAGNRATHTTRSCSGPTEGLTARITRATVPRTGSLAGGQGGRRGKGRGKGRLHH